MKKMFLAILFVLCAAFGSALTISVPSDSGSVYGDVVSYNVTALTPSNITIYINDSTGTVASYSENDVLSVAGNFSGLVDDLYDVYAIASDNGNVTESNVESVQVVVTLTAQFDGFFGCYDTTSIFADMISNRPSNMTISINDSLGEFASVPTFDVMSHGGINQSGLADNLYTVIGTAALGNGTNVTFSRNVNINASFAVSLDLTSSNGTQNTDTIIADATTNLLASKIILTLLNGSGAEIGYTDTFDATTNNAVWPSTPDGNYQICAEAMLENGCPVKVCNAVIVDAFAVTNVTTSPAVAQGTTSAVNFTTTSYPVNVTITLYKNSAFNAELRSVIVNASSDLPVNFTVPSGLSAGTYVVNMTVVDALGNIEVFQLGTFTITSGGGGNNNNNNNNNGGAAISLTMSASISATCLEDDVTFSVVSRSNNNDPLDNVRIDIFKDGDLVDTVVTTNKGKASVSLDELGEYTARFIRTTYSSVERTFEINEHCQVEESEENFVSENDTVVTNTTATTGNETTTAPGLGGLLIGNLPGIIGLLISLLLIAGILFLLFGRRRRRR